MFEMPEMIVFARQMKEQLTGKVIDEGLLSNAPHKFVWHNRTHEEFSRLTRGKTVGSPRVKGRWLLLDIEPGYVLVFGECGGTLRLCPAGTKKPAKYHLLLRFTDGSFLYALTQMWGAYELYDAGEELKREYIAHQKPVPLSPEFSPEYFRALVADPEVTKRSVKSLLTQEQTIPGLGNACAQDIMFRARLHPKYPLSNLSGSQTDDLYRAILKTVCDIADAGGRNDETDLFGNSGGYRRLMDKHAEGAPCPVCGAPVAKIAYLGGACYFCPSCQKLL